MILLTLPLKKKNMMRHIFTIVELKKGASLLCAAEFPCAETVFL